MLHWLINLQEQSDDTVVTTEFQRSHFKTLPIPRKIQKHNFNRRQILFIYSIPLKKAKWESPICRSKLQKLFVSHEWQKQLVCKIGKKNNKIYLWTKIGQQIWLFGILRARLYKERQQCRCFCGVSSTAWYRDRCPSFSQSHNIYKSQLKDHLVTRNAQKVVLLNVLWCSEKKVYEKGQQQWCMFLFSHGRRHDDKINDKLEKLLFYWGVKPYSHLREFFLAASLFGCVFFCL